jgi:hypothetical protein
LFLNIFLSKNGYLYTIEKVSTSIRKISDETDNNDVNHQKQQQQQHTHSNKIKQNILITCENIINQ